MVRFSFHISLALPVVLTSVLLIAITPSAAHGGGGDELTQEELELVAKLREIVKDIVYKDWMNTDEYLVRWLRTRRNNLKAARAALQEALDWRRSNGIDHILAEDFRDVENEFTLINEGVDKNGHPISIFNVGSADIRRVVISGRGKRFTRFIVQCFELTEHALRDLNYANAANASILRPFYILDFHGFNLRQHACAQCIQALLSLFQTYESYFPDIAYKVFGLNTPRAFLPLAELVRPFMSAPSQRALQLFDSNADRWKKALLDEIDPDQLPIQYGDTRMVHSKTMSSLKKTNPRVKPFFDRAANENFQSKLEGPEEVNG